MNNTTHEQKSHLIPEQPLAARNVIVHDEGGAFGTPERMLSVRSLLKSRAFYAAKASFTDIYRACHCAGAADIDIFMLLMSFLRSSMHVNVSRRRTSSSKDVR